MKKFHAAFGRIPEYLAQLTDDEKQRAARRSGRGVFDDDYVQIWPSRGAMLATVEMQRRRAPDPMDWHPLVKPA